MIEVYDGKGRPDTIKLDRASMWPQIHNLPNLYRSQTIDEQLVTSIWAGQESGYEPIKGI